MSTDKAGATINQAFARHVARIFEHDRREATAAQIRRRITDDFEATELQTGQDNQPPALVALHRRIVEAFPPAEKAFDTADRFSDLAEIRNILERQRSTLHGIEQKHLLEHAKSQLLNEWQQLSLKNELTEGFGRIEALILSFAFLTLVLLNAVSILWALPLLALSICRAWYLDRQCKRRLGKITDIDSLIEQIDHALVGQRCHERSRTADAIAIS